uniref:hypothetical protein n=1 Tax=Klebsiella grimontii TaxID=2058152 RepID=UPI002363CFF0|nr:hypothetical protein [Klebsiella grimontii]
MFIGVVRTAGTGYRPDEGPANAQRRQLVLKNAGGNLKLSRTPREILEISLNMLRSDPNRAFTITCNSRPAA